MSDRRIKFERRVGRIGFMGRGSRVPHRYKPEAPHSIAIRIGQHKVLTSREQTEATRREMSALPGLPRMLFTRIPDAVVRPETGEDVAGSLEICLDEQTPVVPRGSATAGLGGSIPVRGGIVIDTGGLAGIADMDPESFTATVNAGAIWSDVRAALEGRGFTLLSYPSSAAGSTVGGWASTGGYGIGTLKHGNFHRQIQSLEVALPSGFLIEATGAEGRYSISTFTGTEGQIGIITRVTMKVMRVPEKTASLVIRPRDFTEGIRIYEKVQAMECPPCSVELADSGAAALYADRAGDGGVSGANEGAFSGAGEGGVSRAGPGRPFLLMSDRGGDLEVRRFVDTCGALLSGSDAEVEAGVDADALRLKRYSNLMRLGEDSSWAICDVLVRSDLLGRLLSWLRGWGGPAGKGGVHANKLLECRAVDRGLSLVSVTCLTPGEGMAGVPRAFYGARRVLAGAVAMGAVPYGAGIWNSPYINVILGKRKKELARIKGEVDRLHILNPGKFFSITTSSGIPVPGWTLKAIMRLGRA